MAPPTRRPARRDFASMPLVRIAGRRGKYRLHAVEVNRTGTWWAVAYGPVGNPGQYQHVPIDAISPKAALDSAPIYKYDTYPDTELPRVRRIS